LEQPYCPLRFDDFKTENPHPEQQPIGITEYCSVSIGLGVCSKSRWLMDFFDFVVANKIRMLVYFNNDKVEETNTVYNGFKDWAMFAGFNGDENFFTGGNLIRAYSAYRIGLNSSYFIGGSDYSKSKLLPDPFFYGTGTCDNDADCLR